MNDRTRKEAKEATPIGCVFRCDIIFRAAQAVAVPAIEPGLIAGKAFSSATAYRTRANDEAPSGSCSISCERTTQSKAKLTDETVEDEVAHIVADIARRLV